MSVCPQCGAPTNPNDKFCNGCGFALNAPPAPFGGPPPAFGAPSPGPQGFGAPPPPFQPGAQPPPASPYGPPPPPPGGSPFGGPPPPFGAPPPPDPFGAQPPPPFGGPPQNNAFGGPPPSQGQKCQQGHDILPGQSYCAMGHPIALDQMFASDAYGAPAPSPFQPAAQPPPPFGGPPQNNAFGGPPPPQGAPFGGPPPQQGGFGGPPPPPAGGGMQPVGQVSYASGGSQPAFPAAGSPPQAYGEPPFGAPPQAPPPGQGFGAPPPPFGGPPPPPQQQGGFGGPPPPAQNQQFGGGFPPMGSPSQQPPPPQAPPQPQYGGYAAPPAPAPAAPAPAIDMNPQTRILRGFLLSYQNNAQGDFWPLLGGRMTVGRANAGDGIEVQLADATISSRHAAFLVDNVGGTVHIEDTGSTNGTYVNEEHIGFNGRRELKDGDRIRFGGFTTIIKVIGRV